MSGSSTAATGARDRKQLHDQLSLVAKRIALCIGDAPRDTVHSRLRRNEPLAAYTTFRIGGPADLFFEATTADELANAVLSARELDVPYFVLGLGANILVGDKGFRGLVVRNTARHFAFREHDSTCTLWTESGAVVKDLILESVRRGWSGLEHYVGIPSTVGGAVWQNLHFLSPAPERERTMFIAEVFESCEILSEENERRTVGPDYVKFGYDDSVFHHRRDIILAATFRLTKGDAATLHRIMQENLSWRGGKHPWLDWHPSAGSVFKKIEGVGAGRLIDQCGLKGARVGDAQISHIHANIMVNLGHATAHDVRELIAIAQREVEQKHDLRLEPEIGFIGEF
ncbi:MAG: UDP-N-acetylenolpyruvoylglucosamine reductase [Gemmatimonadetes bacterium]|nr:MAG: UDP-N-acetylenolpyruvoylglucosamine reductase [Gemmatimonadota bacterium]